MKFASALAILLAFLFGCRHEQADLSARPDLSRAIASAAPESLRARYGLRPSSYGAASLELPSKLSKALLASGFGGTGKGKAARPVWSAVAGKAVLFSDGWVWITDAEGIHMRSVWFEPGLRADGILQWSDDATQLRLKADGWRRWVYLDLALENGQK